MDKELLKFKYKTISILIVQSVAIAIGIILIVFGYVSQIKELEDKYVNEHIVRLNKKFDSRVTDLEQTAIDWAKWDDTYDFMKNQNSEYIDSNMNYSTLKNLNIDLILYINNQNQVVYASETDNENEEIIIINSQFLKYVQQSKLLKAEGTQKGLIEVNELPIMVVSHAILPSDGSGVSVGRFIVGAYINDELANDFSEDLGISVSFDKYSVDENQTLEEVSIERLDSEQILGTFIKNNIENQPYLQFKIQMPRSIRNLGKQGIIRVVSSVLIIYTVFTTSIFFFDKTILKEMQVYKVKLGHSEKNLAKLNENLEKVVYERTRRLNAIVKAIPDVIFKLDKQGNFIDSEISNVNWLISSADEFTGKNLKDIMPPEIAKEGLEKLEEALLHNSVTIQEYDLEFDGVKSYFEVRFISTKEEEVFAILRNVTEENENKRYIEYLSYHDQLTNLHNRRYYEDQIIVLDNKENLPMTVAMIDVNGLKLINDIFGHNKGDILICKIAEILDMNRNEQDLLARIGGDEFVFVFPNTSHDEAEARIEIIQKMVSESRIENIEMSIAIGIDTKVDMNVDLTELLVSAENKMYRKKLLESQTMRKNTVEGILNNIYQERSIEKEHSLQVKEYSMLMGKVLNFSDGELDELEKSALSHDIGKVSLDDELLDLPRSLSHDEFEQVKKHSENGYQLLKSVDSYAAIAENVLSHHEYWDGNGYPRNIKGKAIPLISRIISIAEAYDAMITFRPYKEKYTKEQAKKELIRCSGTQFDPTIVDVFLNKCI